jgi:phytoene dehydrogenase-like protein
VAASRDVVIIGGGHNGLVTAFYLARAGFKPLVLERRPTVGGAATTEEFCPGFRCPALAHSAGPLLPAVARDMQLERHGVAWIEPRTALFSPSPDGRALVVTTELSESARNIGVFSQRDAEKYIEFAALLERYSKLVARLVTMTPPDIEKPSKEELWGLLGAGRQLRGLGKKDMMRLIRYAPMAVADFAAEFFETELLRAAVAARGVFGAAMGPWSAGSTAQLLLRAAADAHPTGRLVFPRGGMGAMADAMAAAATAAGAEIRTAEAVERILVKDGIATGVALASGEEISARAVISNADPRRTFLQLVDPVHLEPGFVVKMQHFRGAGVVAKVNLALDGLPAFAAAKVAGGDGSQLLAGRIVIAPEIDYIERAFDASKYGEFSPRPYLDAAIPSLSDATLAPAGKHVMSVCMQFAPYKLRGGDWSRAKDALADTAVKTLAEFAPDLPQRVLARQVITPVDIEQIYGLTGGHIFHGELALDQLFTMRPILGWAQYRTPLRGLYLCGNGTHPGNGLTGASGANAAREILKDLR